MANSNETYICQCGQENSAVITQCSNCGTYSEYMLNKQQEDAQKDRKELDDFLICAQLK